MFAWSPRTLACRVASVASAERPPEVLPLPEPPEPPEPLEPLEVPLDPDDRVEAVAPERLAELDEPVGAEVEPPVPVVADEPEVCCCASCFWAAMSAVA
jgi:hypothetical protein